MRFATTVVTLSFVIGSTTVSAQEQQELPPLDVTAPASKNPSAAQQKKTQSPAPLSPPQTIAYEEPASAAFLDYTAASSAIGNAQSASQGIVDPTQIAAQPVFRTGELLEAVPGLIVTQHSGEGKANQYFLRGFNLDHGTDLAISVDGMPVNMRTHGHGQGYADTNFMIPEIMRGLAYRKGPYYAAEGDFASAGAIHLDIIDQAAPNFAQVEVGSFGHRRAVAAMSAPIGVDGTVLVAGEAVKYDGPWDRPDDLQKLNGVMRYSRGSYANGFAITAMAYSGDWYATDQVPLRAVEDGTIGRYGTLDPTDGGTSHRYSLSGRWHETDASSATRISAYAVKSDLSLFNNFTFFLNDPINGDQFRQTDDRIMVGGKASKSYFRSVAGIHTENTIGMEGRYDDVTVGLFNTRERQHLSTIRTDNVREGSVAIFAESTQRWTSWMRTTFGLRGDLYATDVSSNIAANSGDEIDAILSPKFGLAITPWEKTELYFNAGTGFHSNDARGTVTTIDPASGLAVDPSPFLVRAEGAEIGVRTEPARGIVATAAIFILDFDSEIVFVGDAGTTEASRPSRRIGGEFTLQAMLAPGVSLDFDAAYTHARFREDDPSAPGRRIPGAIEGVVSAGLSFEDIWGGWFGGVKVRYFGPRPLIEDNSVRTDSSTPVSARLGYRFDNGFTVALDAFNLFDEKSSQIDYYYGSQLAGEAGEVEDIHFHPLEPRSFRLSLSQRW